MYNQRLFKILVVSSLSILVLSAFREKFSEQNQTGSPRGKKEDKNEIDPKPKTSNREADEDALKLELGPPTNDRKMFDGWYKQLEDNIRNKADIKDRLETLHQGLAKIEKDKEKLKNLNFNEEIEIDFLIKPLKLLPKVSQFNVSDCYDYKMKILSHFDPTSEEEIKDPSLKKALSVFKLICTN